MEDAVRPLACCQYDSDLNMDHWTFIGLTVLLSPGDEARNTEEGRAPQLCLFPADAPEPLPGPNPLLLPPVRALSFRIESSLHGLLDRPEHLGEALMSGPRRAIRRKTPPPGGPKAAREALERRPSSPCAASPLLT